MPMIENGISTTTVPCQEQYKVYPHLFNKRVELCQYDYRHTNGELFSCVASSLEMARVRRDEWLIRNLWVDQESSVGRGEKARQAYERRWPTVCQS